MAVVDIGTNKARARGRKDSDGHEQNIEPGKVQENIEELVELHRKAHEAAEAYSSGIKSIAEKAGVHSANLRKLVAARASEDFAEKAARVAQLALLFEECPED